MEEPVVSHLLDLNRQFYQTFALQFSATRGRLQPGVLRVLEGVPADARLLDLGCGNGALARHLCRKDHRGVYVGVDASEALLAEARKGLPESFAAEFLHADLAQPGWDSGLPDLPFDFIFAFAVLHHLPGAGLRRRLLADLRSHLAQEGRFAHSEWQFLSSPRLQGRIQPWEKAGLTPEQVDPGDCLLDWRRGGTGLRYVHHFSEQELAALAGETGFEILASFLSDGQGGRLSLYQIWKRV